MWLAPIRAVGPFNFSFLVVSGGFFVSYASTMDPKGWILQGCPDEVAARSLHASMQSISFIQRDLAKMDSVLVVVGSGVCFSGDFSFSALLKGL